MKTKATLSHEEDAGAHRSRGVAEGGTTGRNDSDVTAPQEEHVLRTWAPRLKLWLAR